MRFAIPGLAGWLIDTTGFATIYYAQAVFYLIAISATSRLPAGVTIRSVRHSVVSEMKHGLRYVVREKNLLVILIFALLAAILSMPYLQLMPLFGIVFGILVWGDRPGWRLYIGGAVVLLGILIITLRARKKTVLQKLS